MRDDDPTKAATEEKYVDPVIEYYKVRIDREAIRRNLKLTVEQRLNNLMDRLKALEEAGMLEKIFPPELPDPRTPRYDD